MNREQEYVLRFFKNDYGDYGVASLLADHPLAQELDLPRGTILARFKEQAIVIRPDGAFSPIPQSSTPL